MEGQCSVDIKVFNNEASHILFGACLLLQCIFLMCFLYPFARQLALSSPTHLRFLDHLKRWPIDLSSHGTWS